MRQLLSLIALSLVSGSAFAAAELVSLPIKDIQHNRQGNTVQVEVAMDFQPCKYNFKGLYLEPVAGGQGQTRYRVIALGTESNTPGACEAGNNQTTTRNEALVFQAVGTDRYDFVK